MLLIPYSYFYFPPPFLPVSESFFPRTLAVSDLGEQ